MKVNQCWQHLRTNPCTCKSEQYLPSSEKANTPLVFASTEHLYRGKLMQKRIKYFSSSIEIDDVATARSRLQVQDALRAQFYETDK